MRSCRGAGIRAASSESTIATSDTGIVDRCTQPVLDLGGHIVTNAFGARPVDMDRLCASGAVPVRGRRG